MNPVHWSAYHFPERIDFSITSILADLSLMEPSTISWIINLLKEKLGHESANESAIVIFPGYLSSRIVVDR